VRGFSSSIVKEHSSNPVVDPSARLEFSISRRIHCATVYVKVAGPGHRRYIGKLYAKEVVLINFPHESASEITGRLIEVLVRIEDSL